MITATPSHVARAPEGAADRPPLVRPLRLAGPAILLVAGLAALSLGLAVGGGAAPLQPESADPGAIVRWGLPIAQLIVNLAAAGMAGSLVLALFGLRAGERAWDVALDVASLSAAVFTVAAALNGWLTFLNVFNPKVTLGPAFSEQLGRFLTELELGRTWLITTVVGAVLTVLIFALRSWTSILLVAVLALASLVPMATQGHSGELATHDAAVISLALHTLAAAIWVGGLVLLVIVRPLLEPGRLAPLVARYSSLALFAFVVVAISGLARSVVSLQAWSALISPYGLILISKVAALAGLGALGAWYRLRLIRRMDQPRASRRFWGLVLLELALMGLAGGAAVALSRTATPIEEIPPATPTPAELLTGSPLPVELLPMRWLTMWNIDLLWLLVAVFLAFFYVAGVRRLSVRGDRWPLHRTIFWLAGLVVLVWVTSGAVNVYQDYLFSVHMIGHMLLTMGIPLMLVAGAPVTLALRAIHKRDDGTRGGREWILWAVHSPYAKVITNSWVAAILFVASLWVFYYTDLLRWSLYDHLGHEWMVLHFLFTGYLFVLALVGIDPIPSRVPYAFRLVLLMAVLAAHAFFGLAIMMQTGLFAAEWYGSMGRVWGPTPLEDQYIGGGVAWSIGELPTLAMAIAVALQWSRTDERIQRRLDRHAQRTGEAELNEYNEYLARLAAQDARNGQ